MLLLCNRCNHSRLHLVRCVYCGCPEFRIREKGAATDEKEEGKEKGS